MSVFTEFKDVERSGWFIGIGRAMMTRVSLFRETKGVAVEMVNRVYDLPPFSGNFKFLTLKPLFHGGFVPLYWNVEKRGFICRVSINAFLRRSFTYS